VTKFSRLSCQFFLCVGNCNDRFYLDKTLSNLPNLMVCHNINKNETHLEKIVTC
jgi:hypothetical protein